MRFLRALGPIPSMVGGGVTALSFYEAWGSIGIVPAMLAAFIMGYGIAALLDPNL